MIRRQRTKQHSSNNSKINYCKKKVNLSKYYLQICKAIPQKLQNKQKRVDKIKDRIINSTRQGMLIKTNKEKRTHYLSEIKVIMASFLRQNQISHQTESVQLKEVQVITKCLLLEVATFLQIILILSRELVLMVRYTEKHSLIRKYLIFFTF